MPFASLWLMAPASPGQSPLTAMLPVLFLVLIFYFLLIAPVRKRQKQHDEMVGNLKTGDRVVTSGGIYGTVVGIRDDRLQLRIADQVKIDVTKASISNLADSTE